MSARMRTFLAIITTETGHWIYQQIANSSFDVHASAIDRFGPCKISVRAA